MGKAITKLAKLLQADAEALARFSASLGLAMHTADVSERIIASHEKIMRERLAFLGIKSDRPRARSVFEALAAKLKTDDVRLFQVLGEPRHLDAAAYEKIIAFVHQVTSCGEGFFLKEDRARQLLKGQPPRTIIQSLAYGSVEELLAKENIWEIFCALRFMENSDWLHKSFLAQYDQLTPDDFERREIKSIVLSDKWREPAEYHLRHSYFNVSHLKELGCMFVIPWTLDRPGESMRVLALLSHYCHEIIFYARLFERAAKEAPEKFGDAIVSLIQGDAPSKVPVGNNWMIIQRYLAKKDPQDWRIYYPHVNPEAIHWSHAQNDISRFGKRCGIENLEFWSESDWIGDYFADTSGSGEEHVSFNLMDTVASVLEPVEGKRHRYHQQEALWNRLFAEYIGEDALEEYIINGILRGYFSVSSRTK